MNEPQPPVGPPEEGKVPEPPASLSKESVAEQPAQLDPLAALFKEESVGSLAENEAAKQLRLQCDISGMDRRKNIQTRLDQMDEVGTALGLQIIKSLNETQGINTQLIEELQTQGVDYLSTAFTQLNQQGHLDQATVLRSLGGVVEHYSEDRLNQGIFTELSFDQKSQEEGARRQKGETSLVVAKAGLLAASIQEVSQGNFNKGSELIGNAKVSIQEYPQWFVSGLEASLKQFDLQGMGEADIPRLEELNNLYYRVSWVDSADQPRIMQENLDNLHGIEYAYRKCKDAGERLKVITAEKKQRDEIIKHDIEYRDNAKRTFGDQAERLRELTAKNLAQEGSSWPLNISLEGGGSKLMNGMLGLDRVVWAKYIEGYKSVPGVLGILRIMSADAHLDKVVTAMLDQGSGMHEYHDGTYTGSIGYFDKMTPERARAAAKIKAERLVLASAFGILQARFESKSIPGNEQYTNQKRLETVISVMQLVGKGRAQDLLAGKNPEQFNENQIQFREEMVLYLTQLQKDNPEAAKLLGAGLREGAISADSAIRKEQELKVQQEQEAMKKFGQFENGVVDARRALDIIPEAVARAEAAKKILNLDQNDLPYYIKVEGNGADRKLVVNELNSSELQGQLNQVEVSLAQELDSSKRLQLMQHKAEIEVRLQAFSEFTAALPHLVRFSWSEGFPVKKSHAAYDVSSLREYISGTGEFEQMAQVLYSNEIDPRNMDIPQNLFARLGRLEAKLDELRSGNIPERVTEVEMAIKEVEIIQARVTELADKTKIVAGKLVKRGVGNALCKTSPLTSLSQRKGPFEKITKYRT